MSSQRFLVPARGTVLAIAFLAAVAVGQSTCGDCFPDGVTDIRDAARAAGLAAGLEFPPPFELANCDVAQPPGVDIIDAVTIAQSIIGIPVTFACPPVAQLFPVAAQEPFAVAVADMDDDGKADIVVGTSPPGGGGTLEILFGDGAGGFPATQVLPNPTGSGISNVLVADFDLDGAEDVITTDYDNNSFSFWPGVLCTPGTGVVGAPVQTVVTGAGTVAWDGVAADMDNDGDLDFVCIGGSGTQVVIFEFDRIGGVFFGPTESLTPSGCGRGQPPFLPVSVAVADINEDGLKDVLVAYQGTSEVVIYRQELTDTLVQGGAMGDPLNGRDTFFDACRDDGTTIDINKWATFTPTGGIFPSDLMIADMDRDGNLDAVTVNFFFGDASILFGEGSDEAEGGFSAPRVEDLGLRTVAFSIWGLVEDINRDGVPDVAATGEGESVLAYLRGLQGRPGETLNYADTQQFALGMGPVDPTQIAMGDLNQDGGNDLVTPAARNGGVDVLFLTAGGGRVPRGFLPFKTALSFETQDCPVDLATGDMIGSGQNEDLVVVNRCSGTVSVFEGNDTGLNFPGRQDIPAGTGGGPTAVAVGDLDGASRGDFAVCNAIDDQVLVYINDDNGSFIGAPGGPSFTLTMVAGSAPADIGLADLNNDTYQDIVTANAGNNTVSVFLSANTPIAQAPPLRLDFSTGACTQVNSVGCIPQELALGDVNGDGATDVVTGNNGSYDLAILLNDGNGNLTLNASIPTGAPIPITGICLADVDENQTVDYCVSRALAAIQSTVLILPGDGMGGVCQLPDPNCPQQLVVAVGAATGAGTSDVACADLNGDGHLDLAVPNRLGGTVTVIQNELFDPQTPPFELLPSNCKAGRDPVAITIGDPTGDSHLDILTANENSDSVTLIRGTESGFQCTLVQFATGTILDMVQGDFNDDYMPDVMILRYFANANSVGILENSGNEGEDLEDFTSDDVYIYDPSLVSQEDVILQLRDPPILAFDTADVDQDGDLDFAYLSGAVSGGVLQVHYAYRLGDQPDNDYFLGDVVDNCHLIPLVHRTTLPLMDDSAPPGAFLGGRAKTVIEDDRFYDLQLTDINHDGLTDTVVLDPVAGYVIVTLMPGVTANQVGQLECYSLNRWTDYVGDANSQICGGGGCNDAPGAFHPTDYTPAVDIYLGFGPITQYPIPIGPGARSMRVADAFPRDGNLEIWVTHDTGDVTVIPFDWDAPLATIGILAGYEAAVVAAQGLPPGSPAFPDPFPTGAPLATVVNPFPPGVNGPYDLALSDINNDGVDDAVLAQHDNGGWLSISAGVCGTGPSQPLVSFEARDDGLFTGSEDWNRDFYRDAVVVSDADDVMSAFYFEEAAFPAISLKTNTNRADHIIGTGPFTDILQGDVNSDGRPDVLISSGTASEITILFTVVP